MKSLHSINIFATVVLFISLQSSQITAQATQAAAPAELRIGKLEGVVIDDHSHNPLVGAIVTWLRNSGEVENKGERTRRQNGMQGSTDAFGRFSFAIPLGGRENEEDETTVLVTVQANVSMISLSLQALQPPRIQVR